MELTTIADEDGSTVDGFPSTKFQTPTKTSRLMSSAGSPCRSRMFRADGRPNVLLSGVDGRLRRYVADLATSLYELPLAYHLAAFILGLCGSWTLFALLWWAMSAAHGDLGMDDVSDSERDSMCIQSVYDFTSSLIFSVETQTTIGYGSRVVSPSCTPSLVLLMVQLVVGAAIDCVLAGFFFDRLTRPTRTGRRAASTDVGAVRFGRRAVICRRNGAHCLAFRVWYRGRSALVGASMRAVVVQRRTTAYDYENGHHVGIDGDKSSADVLPSRLDQFPKSAGLRLEPPAGDHYVPVAWPETVLHRIDESSPLWDVSADELRQFRTEILVVVEGTVESTGVPCRYATSYSAVDDEQDDGDDDGSSSGHPRIVWGQRLATLDVTETSEGGFKVDCSAFDVTVKGASPLPRCSAREFDERLVGSVSAGVAARLIS